MNNIFDKFFKKISKIPFDDKFTTFVEENNVISFFYLGAKFLIVKSIQLKQQPVGYLNFYHEKIISDQKPELILVPNFVIRVEGIEDGLFYLKNEKNSSPDRVSVNPTGEIVWTDDQLVEEFKRIFPSNVAGLTVFPY